ncbi:MAG: hypothetical protein WCW77_03455 [Patescibacteria group bacterium]|jgi:hypothetical protein
MFDYIQKFKGLPKEVYEKLSGPNTTSIIDRLEKEYSVSLAKLVMLAAIKEVPVNGLENYISGEFNLDFEKAKKLTEALKKEVFFQVADYLKAVPAAVPGPGGKKEPAVEIKSVFPARVKTGMPGAKPVSPGLKAGPSIRPVAETKKEFSEHKNPPALIKPAAEAAAKIESVPAKIAPARIALKPQSAIKAAPFFFSTEDEEEIGKLTSRMSGYLKDDSTISSIQKTLDSIVREFGNNFSSEDSVSRLRQILRTYLQGIRNRLETKLTLQKEYKSGGMGIDDQLAGNILSFIEDGKSGGEKPKDSQEPAGNNGQSGKISASGAFQSPGLRDVDYNLKKEIEKRKEEISKLVEKDGPSAETVSKEKAQRIREDLSKAIQSAKKEGLPLKKTVIDAVRPAQIIASGPRKLAPDTSLGEAAPFARSETNGKRKIEDVRYTPKILTPIEELKYLDLINFRHLYKADPAEATGKIKEKIELLEEEEYAKRLQGIRAWRESPLMGLYLEMGQEGIAKKKTMAEMVEVRKKDGRDYLTEDELHAIMDFNRELRF